jgi:hypothetical protein
VLIATRHLFKQIDVRKTFRNRTHLLIDMRPRGMEGPAGEKQTRTADGKIVKQVYWDALGLFQQHISERLPSIPIERCAGLAALASNRPLNQLPLGALQKTFYEAQLMRVLEVDAV